MSPESLPSPAILEPKRVALAIPLLIAVTVVTYANSFRGSFVFDDFPAIVENPSIRSLVPISAVLSPPQGGTSVQGRPLLNLSFALNYSLGALDVWGYHALNLAFHVLSGLLLFGVVRRTLQLPTVPVILKRAAVDLAAAVAVVWLVHPLQTESVTYIVQRAESLAGLLILATLYCSMRAAGPHRSARWTGAAVVMCFLGVFAKEVAVAAPVMVVAYDRCYLYPSLREAWMRRRWLYAGLFMSWIPLAVLVGKTGDRGGSAGFGGIIGTSDYVLTQAMAVARYVRLAFWPHPLIVDYGPVVAPGIGSALLPGILVLFLISATVWLLVKLPRLGFLGFFFFAALAPSSSIVPVITQTVAEHRMYLALAPIVVLCAVGIHIGIRGLVLDSRAGATGTASGVSRLPLVLGVLVVAVFVGLTVRRNHDYSSEERLWRANVAAWPQNLRAHTGVWEALMQRGAYREVVAEAGKVVELNAGYAEGWDYLGRAKAAMGQLREAVQDFTRAITLRPNLEGLYGRRGEIYGMLEEYELAIGDLTRHLESQPDAWQSLSNRGLCYRLEGRLDLALADFNRAIEIQPRDSDLYLNRAVTYFEARRLEEAWRDVDRCRELGGHVDPSLLRELGAAGVPRSDTR